MQKYKNKTKGKFRSKLEALAAELLDKEGIWYRYEPYEVTFLSAHKSKIESYERIGKQFKLNKSIRKISYKPDFVGTNWVMETKGMRTPDFNIKWKLYKKHLEEQNLDYLLLMPTNKKEILYSIGLIKQKLKHEEDKR